MSVPGGTTALNDCLTTPLWCEGPCHTAGESTAFPGRRQQLHPHIWGAFSTPFPPLFYHAEGPSQGPNTQKPQAKATCLLASSQGGGDPEKGVSSELQ